MKRFGWVHRKCIHLIDLLFLLYSRPTSPLCFILYCIRNLAFYSAFKAEAARQMNVWEGFNGHKAQGIPACGRQLRQAARRGTRDAFTTNLCSFSPTFFPKKPSRQSPPPLMYPSPGLLHVTAAVNTFLPQDVPAYLSLWCVNYNYFRCKGKGDEVSSIFWLGGPG